MSECGIADEYANAVEMRCKLASFPSQMHLLVFDMSQSGQRFSERQFGGTDTQTVLEVLPSDQHEVGGTGGISLKSQMHIHMVTAAPPPHVFRTRLEHITNT